KRALGLHHLLIRTRLEGYVVGWQSDGEGFGVDRKHPRASEQSARHHHDRLSPQRHLITYTPSICTLSTTLRIYIRADSTEGPTAGIANTVGRPHHHFMLAWRELLSGLPGAKRVSAEVAAKFRSCPA